MFGNGPMTTVSAGSIYGSSPYLRSSAPSVQEQRNVNPAVSGGAGLAQIMNQSGEFATGVTGLSLPALLALGVMAWVLFRVY